MVKINPYYDENIDEKTTIRTFKNVRSQDLIWHKDLKNRRVEVLEVGKWFFQFDNQMPFEMKKGDVIEIPKMEFHRIIFFRGDLKLKIIEV